MFLLVEHSFCFQYPQEILSGPFYGGKVSESFVHKSPLIFNPLNLVIVWLSSETVKNNIPLEL